MPPKIILRPDRPYVRENGRLRPVKLDTFLRHNYEPVLAAAKHLDMRKQNSSTALLVLVAAIRSMRSRKPRSAELRAAYRRFSDRLDRCIDNTLRGVVPP